MITAVKKTRKSCKQNSYTGAHTDSIGCYNYLGHSVVMLCYQIVTGTLSRYALIEFLVQIQTLAVNLYF